SAGGAHADEGARERDEESTDGTLPHSALQSEGEDDREDDEPSGECDTEVGEGDGRGLPRQAFLLRKIAREGEHRSHPEGEREEGLPRRGGDRPRLQEIFKARRQIEAV